MIKLVQTSKGFSLVELMIAIAIFGVIAGLVVNSNLTQKEQHISQMQIAEMQQSARASLFLIKRELRTAGFSQHQTKYGAGIIAAAHNTNSITIAAVSDTDGLDNNGDVTVDEIGELKTTTISLLDTNGDGNFEIVSNTNGVNTIIAENIVNLNFELFDATGAGAAPVVLADIRNIRVTVTAGTDVTHRAAANSTRTLISTVYLKNNLNTMGL